MKPTPELINDWHEKSRQMAIQADGYFDDVEHWRHFAELAAQWGRQAAQHEAENAPWLTTAHMICTDAGIAHGHITERLEALRDKLADKAQQTTEETDAEMALRSIASWLGVGGFNAPTVDAKAFERKIYEGVEMAIKSHYATAEEPEAWSIPEWSKQDDLGGRVPSDVRVALNEAHRAGVRSGMGQSQWQPIETAPKDGRSFDVWVKSTKNPDYGVRMTGVYYVQGVLCGSRFPNSSWCEYASHWMPLPEPPAMQGDNHE